MSFSWCKGTEQNDDNCSYSKYHIHPIKDPGGLHFLGGGGGGEGGSWEGVEEVCFILSLSRSISANVQVNSY